MDDWRDVQTMFDNIHILKDHFLTEDHVVIKRAIESYRNMMRKFVSTVNNSMAENSLREKLITLPRLLEYDKDRGREHEQNLWIPVSDALIHLNFALAMRARRPVPAQ